MNSLKYIFYITSIFLLFLTCKKREKLDLSTIQTYHHLAIPLVNAQIGIEELLKKDTGGLVTTNPQTGEILLAYESSSISVSASEIIDIPNQSFSKSFSPPAVPFFQVGKDTTFSAQIIEAFSLGNKKLDSISFSYGENEVIITNNLMHDIEVTINIPSLVRKNASSVFFYNHIINVAANSNKDTLINLSIYNLDLTQGSLGYNELIVDYSVKIIGSGAPIAPNDDLTIDFTMENLEFARIDGDFKYVKDTLSPSLLTLSIFNLSDTSLVFSLTNPTIKHTIVNSFGFDISLGMEEMYYEDLSGNFIDSIRYNSSGPGFSPTSAPFNFLPKITQSTTNSIIMDSTNSNIGQLINATPKTIISKPFIEINPDTSLPNDNYIESSSEISVSTEITLPLEGYAEGWIMRDTIPFNAKVDELFSSETSIDSAIIKFTTTNYFPLDVILDLILLDSTGLNPIDTIASNKLIIESGLIDANGKITTAQAKLTTLPCDGTCVDNLNNTRFIVLRLSIGTTGVNAGQSVKIYEDYNIELDISLSISGRMF